MNKLSKIRKFLIILLVLIIAVFLYFKVVPFGKISYERSWPETLKSGKGFINNFTPADRIDLENNDFPRIVGDPIYFSIFTPRTFNRAKLIIKYRDNLSEQTPIIEGGVLVDNLVWRYNLKPIENKIIEQLKFDWKFIQANNNLLLQREKNYDNLESFIEDLELEKAVNCNGLLIECVAFYNYPFDFDYHLINWRPQSLVIDKPLRGLHQFYLYINNSQLELDFEFVDLNQDKGQDPITVNVYKNDELIIQKYLDDNNPNPTSGELEEKSIAIRENNLKEGVYKVEVKISDDVVIKKINSSTNKLSFLNKIWPVSVNSGITLFTDANYLQVKALNPASRQTINFANQDFAIDEIYKQFDFQSSVNYLIKRIDLVKDDLILENNGIFAWSTSSFFNPKTKEIDRYFKLSDQINYILTDYQSPQQEGNWKVAVLEFDLKSAYREKGKYSFIISIPGLKAEDNIDDYLEIKEIEIKLEGRTLWQKVKSWF